MPSTTTDAANGPGASPAVIKCAGLVRRFGEHTVVDHLDLDLRRGEVFGVLGHNGAGKTTTVRLLNGLLAPTAGEVRVLGLDPIADGPALRAQAGVLTESPAVDPRLTGRENLTTTARLFGLDDATGRRRADALLERFGLADRGADRAGEYSKGMKQRLALARTLLHEPTLLYLDEPTSGLDPVATHELHGLLEELVQTGRTIFLCTHNLVEAQRLCGRVAILQQGKKVLEGAPSALAAQFPALARHRLQIVAADVDLARRVLTAEGWAHRPGPTAGMSAGSAAGAVELLVQGLRGDVAADCVRHLVNAGVRVLGFIPEQATLEEIYLSLNHAPPPPTMTTSNEGVL